MKLVEIRENGLIFDDGTTVIDYHEQDCCESVYADWKQLEDTNIFSRNFDQIIIDGVDGSGIRLNGYFVPCYNLQNGYYSSELELIITNHDGSKKIIDISNYVEYQID